MKKVITIILLTIFLTVEISILYSNNIKYQEKNKILTEEIENIGRINEAREEKNKLEEEIRELLSQKTASLDNMEEVIEEENLANANLESEILDLENNIKLLEGDFTKLQTKYNELLKKEEQENTFYITGVPTINQYPDYPSKKHCPLSSFPLQYATEINVVLNLGNYIIDDASVKCI